MLVGLNIYFDYDTPALLAAARQLFPGQEEVVAETVNTYRPDCHPPVLWWAKFEALGEPDWKCAGARASPCSPTSWASPWPATCWTQTAPSTGTSPGRGQVVVSHSLLVAWVDSSN